MNLTICELRHLTEAKNIYVNQFRVFQSDGLVSEGQPLVPADLLALPLPGDLDLGAGGAAQLLPGHQGPGDQGENGIIKGSNKGRFDKKQI